MGFLVKGHPELTEWPGQRQEFRWPEEQECVRNRQARTRQPLRVCRKSLWLVEEAGLVPWRVRGEGSEVTLGALWLRQDL